MGSMAHGAQFSRASRRREQAEPEFPAFFGKGWFGLRGAAAVTLPICVEQQGQAGGARDVQLVLLLALAAEVEHCCQPFSLCPPFQGIKAPRLLVAVQPLKTLRLEVLLRELRMGQVRRCCSSLIKR